MGLLCAPWGRQGRHLSISTPSLCPQPPLKKKRKIRSSCEWAMEGRQGGGPLGKWRCRLWELEHCSPPLRKGNHSAPRSPRRSCPPGRAGRTRGDVRCRLLFTSCSVRFPVPLVYERLLLCWTRPGPVRRDAGAL